MDQSIAGDTDPSPMGQSLEKAALRTLLDARSSWSQSDEQPLVVRAPGRVNLIGDHTDYNDGFVLPMTLDRAVYVAISRRDDQVVRLLSVNNTRELVFELGERPTFSPPNWACYVTGVIEELLRHGRIPSGFEAAIFGNVPLGAGLSSSAALTVATALSIAQTFRLNLDPIAMADLCQHVEHRYVGVLCGIMDQIVSRIGREGHALFLDCRTLEYEHVPVDLRDLVLVIVDSKASRSLSTSAYNERRRQCEAGVAVLQTHNPEIQALRDVSLQDLAAHSDELHPVVARRCRHVVTENERVQEARLGLAKAHLREFGRLMSASHASLRDDYEVSSDNLDVLVDGALDTFGVFGARLTGAGFGGCTVNLVRRDAVQLLTDQLQDSYRHRFGMDPDVYVVGRNLEAGVVDLAGLR